MEFPGIGADTPTIDSWQAVAQRVASVIQFLGIENFRETVRAVVRERLRIQDERERREEERRKVLKENGVLYRKDSLPEQPEEAQKKKGDWYLHGESLIGKIKLPPKIAPPPKQPKCPSPPLCMQDIRPEGWSEADKDEVAAYRKEKVRHEENMRAFWAEWDRAIIPFFEYVKQQGFPNDEDGDYEYRLPVCCWLPNNSEPADPDDFNPNPAKDPAYESLLPVPPRALTDAEKKTILAAVYDAHWRGGEKVAPWGVAADGARPESWPEHAELADRRAAHDYYRLFWHAQELGDSDLPVVVSWLDELEPAGREVVPPTLPSAQSTPEARAILFVQEQLKTTGRLPTKTAIAQVLEVNRRTLNNWSAFKVAYKKLQSENRRQPPKGTKAKDGSLEAWRESGK